MNLAVCSHYFLTDPHLPSQQYGIAALRPVTHYTAWWKRHAGVINFPELNSWSLDCKITLNTAFHHTITAPAPSADRLASFSSPAPTHHLSHIQMVKTPSPHQWQHTPYPTSSSSSSSSSSWNALIKSWQTQLNTKQYTQKWQVKIRAWNNMERILNWTKIT